MPITYNVKRASSRNGPYMLIARGLAEKRYVDAAAENRKTYYYVVCAVGEGGEEGPHSAQVVAKPAAPAPARKK